MNGQRMLIGLLIVALLLALAVGGIQAQGPQPPDEDQPADEAGAVSAIVPIQGRLTDASGNPLSGSYVITATLWNSSSDGTDLCHDKDTVTVDNGLFNMDLNGCTASDISGDSLYLGITVGTDPEMTPRQGIYPVPYAWTVRPGAIIKGADSYVFVPGTAMVKDKNTDTTRWDMSAGSALIYQGGGPAGTKSIRIPITIPSVLYGQPVRVTSIRVYYKCGNGANNYISETELYKQTDADSFVSLVDDTANRTSNTATSYTLSTDSANNTLSADQGILTLRLGLYFVNDTDYVLIGGVRLTLDHDY